MKRTSDADTRRRSRFRSAVVACSLAAAILGLLASAPAYGSDGPCTWGGTVLAPTGTFHIDVPLTVEPSSTDIGFWATAVLSGNDSHCSKPNGKPRTMTFTGRFLAGASCAGFRDEGTVSGVPGVVRFEGSGNAYSSGYLYDGNNNQVGTYDAQVFSSGADGPLDCATSGFTTDGIFSSVLGVSFGN